MCQCLHEHTFGTCQAQKLCHYSSGQVCRQEQVASCSQLGALVFQNDCTWLAVSSEQKSRLSSATTGTTLLLVLMVDLLAPCVIGLDVSPGSCNSRMKMSTLGKQSGSSQGSSNTYKGVTFQLQHPLLFLFVRLWPYYREECVVHSRSFCVHSAPWSKFKLHSVCKFFIG